MEFQIYFNLRLNFHFEGKATRVDLENPRFNERYSITARGPFSKWMWFGHIDPFDAYATRRLIPAIKPACSSVALNLVNHESCYKIIPIWQGYV